MRRMDGVQVRNLLEQLLTTHWNKIVGKRLVLMGETATHFLFVHPTKGKRKISKRRLGVA